MAQYFPTLDQFKALAAQGNLIPIYRRLFSDQITPVLAYRRLVKNDPRHAPSFLLESVVGGERAARYSFLGAQPIAQIIAHGHQVRLIEAGTAGPAPVEEKSAQPRVSERTFHSTDPLAEMSRLTSSYRLSATPDLPDFTGGWVGFAGYDTVRYTEAEKLAAPPPDDRRLPDLHFGLYRQVVAFDHATKTLLAIHHVLLTEHPTVEAAYQAGCAELDHFVTRLETEEMKLPTGDAAPPRGPAAPLTSNLSRESFEKMVGASQRYISAGDIFQVVLSQRFERLSTADPFDVYRALRVINPSPYMFYLQAQGCILIGSSPEILCKVQRGVITNRPLAGTRRRGDDPEDDRRLEAELLADPKERAEHIMLVDLGRNDVGRVATPGSVAIPQCMTVERYSHVMHISSTVTGRLREGLTAWDALRATLPVGTVSGAPKVRAMQIIDELEPTRRGPYAGAVGYADFAGNMDMAIALRTIVAQPNLKSQSSNPSTPWTYHLQAGAGIVADSVPALEFQETVNKSAALARAIDLAESSLTPH